MTSAWRETLQQGLGAAYRIRQELGGGGMSETYIAEEVALGRTVVLKVLPPYLVAGLDVERFQREIHLAARLQHAFIVPVLAAGVTQGQPWYTMPLVQGESLRTRIAREGALAPEATARILRDVAEALTCAHGQGIVHRDIKPDNILLSGAHAMVTDFGIAKALSSSTTSSSTVTDAGTAIGTAAYMAPEQAAGDPATDHRADLYSLGVTAHEMMTGKPLFGARPPGQLLVAHAVERPAPLSKSAPGCPPDLASLVDQLLAKHPNDRPARAQDVADVLTGMLTRWTSGEVAPVQRMTTGKALASWLVAFVGVVGTAWIGVQWLPIPAWALPAAVVLMLATLPVLAMTAWLHRPARRLHTVPSVASVTAAGRIEAMARPHLTWRNTRRIAVGAIAGLALIIAAWVASRALGIGPAATLRAQGRVAATDRVLIAEFDSPSSDSTLGAVVANLLSTEIGRSRSIRLVGSAERERALVALRRPTTSHVGSALARDVSQRANAKIHLTGSVTQLGASYLVRAAIVETSTGEELASFKESARTADDIIGAVDRLGRDIRDRLGVSLREVRGAPNLAFAVTPSLEAARLFTQGSITAQAGDQAAATRVLERAVQVDTEFAMAYRTLSAYYGNLGNVERAAWAGERAFRHREKLPPRLQRLTEGIYYISPSGFDLDKAIAADEAAIDLDPTNTAAWNNLAHVLRMARQQERSLAVYRQAISVDSTSMFASTNITSMMWALGLATEARHHVTSTLGRWQRGTRVLVTARANLAAAELYPDSAQRILEQGLRALTGISPTQRALLHSQLADVQRARGRLAAAEANQMKAFALDPSLDTVLRIPESALFRAELAAWDRGQLQTARRVLDSALAEHPYSGATALGYRWTMLAAEYARAGDAATARVLLARFDSLATPAMRRYETPRYERARGWIAMAEKRYADAIIAFRASDVHSCTTCALAPLAHAYDLANQPDSAIAVFERYLSTRYYYRAATDAMFLAGTYKRLGELYEAKGDKDKAASYYARFVDLWKDADAELQPRVSEVRKRLAVLGKKG